MRNVLACWCLVWAAIALGAEEPALNEAFRPRLYAELPDCCPIPDGMTLCERTGLIYLVCPNYEPSDEQGKKLVRPVLMVIYPDGRLEKVLEFPLEESSQDTGPMGIDLGPDGNLYVADNLFTGKPDGPKSRVLRVTRNAQTGLPTGEVKTVVTGITLANGLLWDGEWMYVTDPVVPKAPGDTAYGKGGLWRFHQSEITGDVPLLTVNPDPAIGDKHLAAVFEVQKTRRGDIGGLDGITKAWDAIWVGNVGDGALFSVTFDADGKAVSKKEFHSPEFRCCDGIFYDKTFDVIFIDDPEDNCIRVLNRKRELRTLWQDPDNDGRNGRLDEPSECIVRDGKLIIANFDRPFPGLVNTKHDKPYTLSVIDLNEACLRVLINGEAVNPSFGSAMGVWFYQGGADGKTQVLLLGHPDATREDGTRGQTFRLSADVASGDTLTVIQPLSDEQWTVSGPQQIDDKRWETVPVPRRIRTPQEPVMGCSDFTPFLWEKMVEWDWRMQDGIETPREARSTRQVVEKMLAADGSLVRAGCTPEVLNAFQNTYQKLVSAGDSTSWNDLWLSIHQEKRRLLLSQPIFDIGELFFVKHVPSVMSHQLTQVYGYCARPGGGLFVLREPGKSPQTRQLAKDGFPMGNFMKSDISPDGKTIYTAFCACDKGPKNWRDPETMARRYQIYSLHVDGTNVQPLTRGDADSFAPVVSPTGEIIYLSTLRGTYHRCGAGPCYLYTLTLMTPNGDNIRPISFHETNEWDPTVLDNGRILYTRWDYVDRSANHYQNLWQTRLDGTDVRIFYGNHTTSVAGIWEARQVPNSNKIMGIAGPHHALSAGSVILVDSSKGVDGEEPLERLTPDVPFNEAENTLAYHNGFADFDTVPSTSWFMPLVKGGPKPASESERRWPGQTFKAPYPLSEDSFIVSYSFDRLFGEMAANIPNQYGLYFADRWGNRELIYRDPNISSLWAIPLVPPKRRIYTDFTPYVESNAVPPVVSRWAPPRNVSGTMLMQNVYDAEPAFPEGTKIKALRIVQVLPKSTPNADQPTVGWPFAAPGKQILGTVPVEEDGSAFFELPACIPVLFQALDEQGRAVQTMRSLTYLQPGENANCIGCHEDRMKSPDTTRTPLAAVRQPSKITPGPDGSKPFSFPILVQPVLDRHCVACHNAEKPNGIVLSGEPEGRYTRSYNGLPNYLSFTAWGRPNDNAEPLSAPGTFGVLGSRLTSYLEPTHYNVTLSAEDKERVYTWLDGANALFYGTFRVEDQARQQRGERIEGPDAE